MCFLLNLVHSQFGEKDPELLKAAIDKFVRSCAGYSVATYVLVKSITYAVRVSASVHLNM